MLFVVVSFIYIFNKTSVKPKLTHRKKKFIAGRSMGQFRKSLQQVKLDGAWLDLSLST